MITDGVYIADKIFTGNEWLYNHAIIVTDEWIADVIPISQILVPATKHFACLIPAFIDIQIYGAAEKLFAVHPTTEALTCLYEYCLKGKTNYFLPTVATNNYKAIYDCIDAVKSYWKLGCKGCLGLHIEGPWINVEKRGAHVSSLIHAPTIEQVKELLEYGKGIIKMITLAPEICNKAVFELIESYGVIISAGHSNATYEQATKRFTEGINTVTHLYNAMSGLQHREPGMVGAVFNNTNVRASIIPDGYHVAFAAIKIAKQIMKERLFVITDAVTSTTEGYYKHRLAGDKYESNNILSGSALTMEKAVHNLVNYCGIQLEEAFRMCSLYPAKVLGLENELGRIEKGFKADFVEWALVQ
jgi:N-acetylglucosamine-6-phosphate deacetylase